MTACRRWHESKKVDSAFRPCWCEGNLGGTYEFHGNARQSLIFSTRELVDHDEECGSMAELQELSGVFRITSGFRFVPLKETSWPITVLLPPSTQRALGKPGGISRNAS